MKSKGIISRNCSEGRVHNRRFGITHLKIVRRLLRGLNRNQVQVGRTEVAESIGITRQGISYHEGDMKKIVPDFISDFQRRYKDYVAGLALPADLPAPSRYQRAYERLFIFIGQNQEVFTLLSSSLNGTRVVHSMLKELYPHLQVEWLPLNSPEPVIDSERVEAFLWRASGIILRWGVREKANLKVSNYCVSQLIALTKEVANHPAITY